MSSSESSSNFNLLSLIFHSIGVIHFFTSYIHNYYKSKALFSVQCLCHYGKIANIASISSCSSSVISICYVLRPLLDCTSKIENEYGNMDLADGVAGKFYIKWAASMATGLIVSFPHYIL
ncbi:hypothetical protein Fmac_030134 [Flemingia macrophylla]|uniref:Uncharacterized protein n=1 Tax=Flemingia macrophylla TaxID=520843 RepID=A0ABD1LCA5_9FABA